MRKIALIAAMSENRVLGKDNKLVWELPADWENFRRVTAGQAFVMGRVSYESEDMLFSDRLNVILSRRPLRWCQRRRLLCPAPLLRPRPPIFTRRQDG